GGGEGAAVDADLDGRDDTVAVGRRTAEGRLGRGREGAVGQARRHQQRGGVVADGHRRRAAGGRVPGRVGHAAGGCGQAHRHRVAPADGAAEADRDGGGGGPRAGHAGDGDRRAVDAGGEVAGGDGGAAHGLVERQ